MTVLQQTVEDRTVLERSSYNYEPVVIHEGALFHLYWCGGVAGDFILHAVSTQLGGPWHSSSSSAPSSFDVALQPTKSPQDFDGLHTCDPSVIKIGSRYFLYYSGAASDTSLTAVGVAESTDGVHFTRMAGGQPIVTPSRTNKDFLKAHLTYGAGQPSIVDVPPYLYLSFTDSTGAGGNKVNGAGQYALRSRDPTFSDGVEELTANCWQPRQAGRRTAEYSYIEAFGIDWAYDEPSHAIVLLTDRDAKHTTVVLLDPRSLKTLASGNIELSWREGPGLVAEADKSMARRTRCDRLPLTALATRSDSADPFTWHTIGYSSALFSLRDICPKQGPK